mgnify:CR=1 FL=1
MNFKVFVVFFSLLLAGGPPIVLAQDAQPAGAVGEALLPEKPVMLGDQVLFHLTTEAEGLSLAKRSNDISQRLQKIADSPRFKIDAITTTDFNNPLTFILAGDEIVMSVLDQDAASKGKSRQLVADEYAQIIHTAIEKYRKECSVEQLVKGAIYVLIGTFIFIAVLILLAKLKNKTDIYILLVLLDHLFFEIRLSVLQHQAQEDHLPRHISCL